jgi:hypothetical protein
VRFSGETVPLLAEFQRIEPTGADASALLEEGGKAEILKKRP